MGSLGALGIAGIDGPLSNDTISYTYDELGGVATRTLGSTTTSWEYDALGRLESLTDPIGTFGFEYDGQTARLAQLSYPNGQTSSYSYFGNTGDRRLHEIHHQTPSSTTLSKFTYAYDVVGNITTWTQQYESTIRAYDFSYDPADQLTSAVYRTTGGSPTILKRYGYAYDAVGNRTNQQVDDAPTAWTYDAMNRLTAQAGTAQLQFEGTVNEAATVTIAGKPATVNGSGAFVGSAAVTNGTNTVAITATDASGNTRTQEYEVNVTNAGGTFSYDANGNLTGRGTRTYSWDAENRLVQVADDGTPIASFTYDGAGRRSSRTTAGVTHNFVYAGGAILEDRIVSGARTRHVQGPSVDRPLASVDSSGNPTYYLADHLGSIVQTTDTSGAVTLTRQYDPYGALLQGESTAGYAFTGREWDAEVGLYYYRARYYDPSCGRFISADPIGFGGGANFYAYVSGSPTNLVDPLGLAPADWLYPSTYGFEFDYNAARDAQAGLAKWADRFIPFFDPFASYYAGICNNGLWWSGLAGDIALQATLAILTAGLSGEVAATEAVAAESRIGATGKIGEDALKALGGESQEYFSTSQGGRFVDQFVNGIAHEAKVGYQSLTSTIRSQISKDVELMASKQIQGSTWHFFTSPVTGLNGPSGPLLNALIHNGIKIIIH